MNLSGRTVLLTGATGGIGHAIARVMAARGAKLLLTGRRVGVLEPLAAETGGRAITCDLSNSSDLDSLLADVGEVDVLVANAALPGSGPLLEYTEEQIDRALAVNLRAPMILARRLGEPMVRRGSGHLVFVSSLAGKTAPGGSSVYSATKFGLRGFALSLRQDLQGTGVGVSTIFPGFVRDAGMLAESGAQLPWFVGSSTSEEVARGVLRAIEKNRAEVDVAPVSMRAGTLVSSMMPSTMARVQRKLGGEDLASAMSEGQRIKR